MWRYAGVLLLVVAGMVSAGEVLLIPQNNLSTTFIKTQLSNEQRLALIARLNERVPIIVRRCHDSPSIRFMSLLPEEIKKWL